MCGLIIASGHLPHSGICFGQIKDSFFFLPLLFWDSADAYELKDWQDWQHSICAPMAVYPWGSWINYPFKINSTAKFHWADSLFKDSAEDGAETDTLLQCCIITDDMKFSFFVSNYKSVSKLPLLPFYTQLCISLCTCQHIIRSDWLIKHI